jgi:acetylornithine deacetylase/succinyl-diaminopimelate desuccinylase-like protein
VLRSSAEEVLKHKVSIYGATGGTDMSHVKRAGTPMCALGPSRRTNNVHSPDEHLPIDDLLNLTKVYALAAIGILGC